MPPRGTWALCVAALLVSWTVHAARVEFTRTVYRVTEHEGSVTLTVHLVDCGPQPPRGVLRFELRPEGGNAVPGEDYLVSDGGAFGRLAADGGGERLVLSHEVPVRIVDDTEREASETLQLAVELEPGGTIDCGDGPHRPDVGSPATLTIVDNDASAGSVELERTVLSTPETTSSPLRIGVARKGGVAGEVSVTCSTVPGGSATDGEDYETTSQILRWADGDSATKSCAVGVIPDETPEGPETIRIALTAPSGATLGRASRALVTIEDDDGTGEISFATSRFTVSEGDGVGLMTVSRDGGREGAVSVTYSTGGGTAVAGTDFIAAGGKLYWEDGDAAPKTFFVTVSEDRLAEETETVYLALTDPRGGAVLGSPNTAVLEITDNDEGSAGETISASGSSTAEDAERAASARPAPSTPSAGGPESSTKGNRSPARSEKTTGEGGTERAAKGEEEEKDEPENGILTLGHRDREPVRLKLKSRPQPQVSATLSKIEQDGTDVHVVVDLANEGKVDTTLYIRLELLRNGGPHDYTSRSLRLGAGQQTKFEHTFRTGGQRGTYSARVGIRVR